MYDIIMMCVWGGEGGYALAYSPLANDEDEVCVDHFSHILRQGVDVHTFPNGWEHVHYMEGGTLKLLLNGFVIGSLHAWKSATS